MKKLQLLVMTSFTIIQLSAQVTLLSGNEELHSGIPISDTKAIFLQGIDGYFLWVTDGTPINTFKLNIPAILEQIDRSVVWNNKLYFSGFTESLGAELWVTDGTDTGTHLIKDINMGAPSSGPRSMIVYNDAIYFFALTPEEGVELWKSNGTEEGTHLVKDIKAGNAGSYNSNMAYALYNNDLYFSADTIGLELWKLDHLNGITMVKDINPGNGSSQPQFLQVLNNELFFTANDGTHGRELWKTNGTGDGTVIVKDIFPNAPGSGISSVLLFNGKLLFNATNAVGNTELYFSDGTTSGTGILKEINEGAAGSNPGITGGIIINNKVVFAATSAATGRELFETDGTENGTILFKDIIEGYVGSQPQIWLVKNMVPGMKDPPVDNQTLYNGKIFISSYYEDENYNTGQVLWITDGTLNNTTIVHPGPYFTPESISENYYYTQGGLYFCGRESEYDGFEVYKSQGTNATTGEYADVFPGSQGSSPYFQDFIVNGKVFFIGEDGDTEFASRTLFSLGANEITLPQQLLQFAAAALKDGVKLNWTTENAINNQYFEVQRSIEGNNFQPIGHIKASGQSNFTKDYDFFDKNAYQQKSATLYYRLKIVDNNGKFKYSPIAFIQPGKNIKGMELSPNPAGDFIRINYHSSSHQKAQIRIINNNGQVVKTITTNLSAGINQEIIGTDKMAAGIYYAELIVAGKSNEVVRFLKD